AFHGLSSQTATCRSLMGIRSGATLMFLGIFLGLVGMTFTDMGWLKYGASRSFEWTQLLGPILLSVGGTFILINICKFRMLSCRACKQSDYDEDLSESLEIPGSGQSFVFNGINQPIMFHGAIVGQYIPAPQWVSANGVSRNLPPQYYTVCPLGNPAFTGDNNSPLNSRSDCRHHRHSTQVDDNALITS
uniref:Transmembrane protein 174 n=1 Tax=Salmo trutta TaxID=8032 RepID=A0A674CF81_SALTR